MNALIDALRTVRRAVDDELQSAAPHDPILLTRIHADVSLWLLLLKRAREPERSG